MVARGPFNLAYMGQILSLPAGTFLIGRSSHCDLTLEDPAVSSEHVRLRTVEGRLFLESLSREGVRMNGTRVTGRAELHPGDTLRVGEQTLRVVTTRTALSHHPTVPPKDVANAPDGDTTAVRSRSRSRTPTIAVVDDSPSVRGIVRVTLESAGYVVLAAETPFEATGLIARERPHLVLVDVGMPGLSGDQIVRFVRTRGEAPDTCILLYSARPAEELERIAQECDADGFIQKSRDNRDLIEAVGAWAWLWE